MVFRIVLGLIVVVILGVLGVAAAGYYYLYGPNSSVAADFLPSSTMVYVTIPNGTEFLRQANGLKAGKLADETRVYWDEAKKQIPADDMAIILSVFPTVTGQLFIAVTDVDPVAKDADVLFGLKPKYGLNTFSSLLDAAKKKAGADLKEGDLAYGGVEYKWFEGKDHTRLFVLQNHGWDVISTKDSAIQGWIDRESGKVDKATSLSQSADYKVTLDKLADHSLAEMYINVPSMWAKGKTQLPGPQNPEVLKRADEYGGIGYGWNFANGNINERYTVTMKPEAITRLGNTSPCAYDTLKMTGPDSVLYMASRFDAGAQVDNLKQILQSDPQLKAQYDQGLEKMSDLGIDLDKNVVKGLGEETAVVADWKEGWPFPSCGYVIQIKDQQAFDPVVKQLLVVVQASLPPEGGEVQKDTVGDYQLSTLVPTSLPMISPTLVTGPYLGLFLTKDEAKLALGRKGSETTIDKNPVFADGCPIANSLSCGMMDTPALIRKTSALPIVKQYLSTTDIPHKEKLQDTKWMEDMGAWSFDSKIDGQTVVIDSSSGIGNQGLIAISATSALIQLGKNVGSNFAPIGAPPDSTPPATSSDH